MSSSSSSADTSSSSEGEEPQDRVCEVGQLALSGSLLLPFFQEVPIPKKLETYLEVGELFLEKSGALDSVLV